VSLQIEVKKLSQDVSIEDGQAITQNYVLFELPNGGIVKAAIDENAADALLDALVKGADSEKVVRQDQGYEPPRYGVQERRDAGPPPGFRETTAPDGGPALEFGGSPEPDVPVPPVVRSKAKLVGKDEYGYPIMRGGAGSVDPGEIASSGGVTDEDGVGQV
jgi:hypothetical protein